MPCNRLPTAPDRAAPRPSGRRAARCGNASSCALRRNLRPGPSVNCTAGRGPGSGPWVAVAAEPGTASRADCAERCMLEVVQKGAWWMPSRPNRLRRARLGGAKTGEKGGDSPLFPRSSPRCRKDSGGGRPLSGRAQDKAAFGRNRMRPVRSPPRRPRRAGAALSGVLRTGQVRDRKQRRSPALHHAYRIHAKRHRSYARNTQVPAYVL